MPNPESRHCPGVELTAIKLLPRTPADPAPTSHLLTWRHEAGHLATVASQNDHPDPKEPRAPDRTRTCSLQQSSRAAPSVTDRCWHWKIRTRKRMTRGGVRASPFGRALKRAGTPRRTNSYPRALGTRSFPWLNVGRQFPLQRVRPAREPPARPRILAARCIDSSSAGAGRRCFNVD
jgi:hypothetical protein